MQGMDVGRHRGIALAGEGDEKLAGFEMAQRIDRRVAACKAQDAQRYGGVVRIGREVQGRAQTAHAQEGVELRDDHAHRLGERGMHEQPGQMQGVQRPAWLEHIDRPDVGNDTFDAAARRPRCRLQIRVGAPDLRRAPLCHGVRTPRGGGGRTDADAAVVIQACGGRRRPPGFPGVQQRMAARQRRHRPQLDQARLPQRQQCRVARKRHAAPQGCGLAGQLRQDQLRADRRVFRHRMRVGIGLALEEPGCSLDCVGSAGKRIGTLQCQQRRPRGRMAEQREVRASPSAIGLLLRDEPRVRVLPTGDVAVELQSSRRVVDGGTDAAAVAHLAQQVAQFGKDLFGQRVHAGCSFCRGLTRTRIGQTQRTSPPARRRAPMLALVRRIGLRATRRVRRGRAGQPLRPAPRTRTQCSMHRCRRPIVAALMRMARA